MIAKFYGKDYSSAYLAKLTGPNKSGVTLLDLANAAERIGFKSLCVKIPAKMLIESAPLPCILFWNFKHFVVLYNISNEQVLIADPAIGLSSISYIDFEGEWCSGNKVGIALLLETTAKFYQGK
jgi:ATP-binding cassette subfamily B protein